MNFEIRKARPTDAPALTDLVLELGYPVTAPGIADRLETLISAGEIVLVATENSNTVGVLTGHVTPVLHRPTPVGRITMLEVTKIARGRGIGRALVEHAEHILKQKGCALVEVTSNEKLTEAHAFYRRLGYQKTSYRLRKSLLDNIKHEINL